MTARAAILAALLVVAGSTLAVAGVASVGAAQPVAGSDPPEETDDRATFTVSTQSIELGEGGTICAEKQAPDVNQVTITDATMNGVELYLGDEEQPKKVTAPTADVDEIVLYTNGENQLVDLLATTGACIPMDQPQQTVLEVYYQESGTLEMEEFQMVTAGTESPPEPGGLSLPDSILENSSSDDPVSNATETLNQTTEVAGNATDAVQTVTGTVNETATATDTVNDTVGDTTDAVNDTTENVTETVDRVENPTETVDDTTDAVNDTVGDTTDTVDDTTETVDGATDAVEDTTTRVGDTVNDTTDTVDDTADSVANPTESPGDTVEDTTTEVEDTVDDTQDTAGDTVDDTSETVDDTTDDTQDTVEDTTTEVSETAEEILPPTAGFGLGENVPLVGESVQLDASGSSDSDGEITKYEWDLDGDGDYEETGQQVTHAFSEPGEREVTLRVTDDDGETDTATETVRVNAPPTAAFSVVSDLLTIGEPISLDATESSDPDGEITKYEWDLDGDGDYEETGSTPSPTFSDLGEREIGLRVTDDDGATDTATETIDLTESDDGGLLGGDDSSDGDDTSTDDGDDTSIIGAILP